MADKKKDGESSDNLPEVFPPRPTGQDEAETTVSGEGFAEALNEAARRAMIEVRTAGQPTVFLYGDCHGELTPSTDDVNRALDMISGNKKIPFRDVEDYEVTPHLSGTFISKAQLRAAMKHLLEGIDLSRLFRSNHDQRLQDYLAREGIAIDWPRPRREVVTIKRPGSRPWYPDTPEAPVNLPVTAPVQPAPTTIRPKKRNFE